MLAMPALALSQCCLQDLACAVFCTVLLFVNTGLSWITLLFHVIHANKPGISLNPIFCYKSMHAYM